MIAPGLGLAPGRMTALTHITRRIAGAGLLLGALAACSPAGAQDTPTPAAETTDVDYP